MTEIYTCFSYLVESSPQWIRDVEELERTIAERQQEMVRVPVPLSHNTKKTPSNESLRDGSPYQAGGYGYGSPNAFRMEVNSNPEAAHNHTGQVKAYDTMHMLLSQRKRKTTSILSNNTAPAKYRSRSMIIVYYDSRVQASFEHLVRSIGTGRNYIRKARMAARMEALSASVGDTDELDVGREIPSFRSTRRMGIPASPGSSMNGVHATDSALIEADVALERAQGYCERGAHQFLRDGVCREETAGTKGCFGELLRVAEKELARQRMKLQERRAEGERRRSAALAAAQQTSVSALAAFGSGPLEADDDNDDDEDDGLDMANMSLPPFRRATART